jgi:hypothetical protein
VCGIRAGFSNILSRWQHAGAWALEHHVS